MERTPIIDQYMRQYAREDIQKAVDLVNSKSNTQVKYKNLNIVSELCESPSWSDDDCISVTAYAAIVADDGVEIDPIEWTYTIEGEDVYMVDTPEDLAALIQFELKDRINASTRIKKRPVMAAVEDIDEYEEFMDDEDGVTDAIDDLADNVDDLQDSVDEVVEDDVDIDVDNNIEGHYIAECERCKGVFISAVIESEEHVEKITGTCPLCDHDTEQYLKWVVKPIE